MRLIGDSGNCITCSREDNRYDGGTSGFVLSGG